MNKQNLIAVALIATFGAAMAGSTFAATPAPAPQPVDVQQEGEHQGVFGDDSGPEPVEAPEAPEAPEVPGR